MYIPDHFAEHDHDTLTEAMAAIRLAAIVSVVDGLPLVTHAPVTLERLNDGLEIRTHFARANDHWRRIADASPTVAIFQGQQGYVTPSWYPTKAETGKVVPTWNYIVVHAHGCLSAVDDEGWVLDQVSAMTRAMEAARPQPWAVSDAPERFTQAMLRGIVGIRMPVDQLEGKWKLSQNKSDADRAGVRAGSAAEAAQHLA